MLKFQEFFKLIYEHIGSKITSIPCDYQNKGNKVHIEYSDKNIPQDQIHHSIKQFLQRSNYTLQDFYLILQRGVDDFLTNSKNKRFRNTYKPISFYIISNSFNKIKIVIHTKRIQDKNFNIVVHTVLDTNMISNFRDNKIEVEETEQIHQIIVK